MLLTVTCNPTIDRILDVPTLTVGEVHRTEGLNLMAAGKGLNVTRAALALGSDVLATAPLGGRSGHTLADLAQKEGLPAVWYWLKAGETRTCILLNHANNDTTVINEPGPTVSIADWTGFATHVETLAQKAEALAFAGSLPLGVSAEAFSELARSLATRRVVYVDTSREALAAILANPQGVCIKVNRTELTIGLNLKLADQTITPLLKAGAKLLDRGAAQVVITLGRHGAVAITPSGVWQLIPPPVQVVSTVGSGDAMLAGLAIARLEGQPFKAALAFGVACGTVNTLSSLPGDVDRTQVEDLVSQVEVMTLESQS